MADADEMDDVSLSTDPFPSSSKPTWGDVLSVLSARDLLPRLVEPFFCALLVPLPALPSPLAASLLRLAGLSSSFSPSSFPALPPRSSAMAAGSPAKT